MRAIINGQEGGELRIFKSGDEPALNIVCLSDAGVQLDVTADTVTLEVYTKKDRSVAATLSSASGTIVGATAGYVTVTLTAANINFGPGTYYAYVKRVENVGSTIEFSSTPVTLIVQ